ncbi:zinc/cadmium/mercury/lead-transporting ATPase [Vibrio sp. DW001]|uniref:zinc/cadmium/mercury/lead-transporting ATPase n=1 Tax=Vibrio sp. DW001 TaxID=2912315 RepID=UPI0023AFF628|nr:zinc/cadmium/mercury/lead-transporting ATPase [Vibrio sp. DW001]WED27818.1 zinc/cadmium/mercury/lead-transporting ATPase [Vibrio sp. DW001]
MCTKHEGCQSKASTQNISSTSCSTPTITQIKAIGAESEGCCSGESGTCSSGSDLSEESDPSGLQSLFTQSWKIAGMDCPSCARKIETAVSNISGVSYVKVLFATEKLVVKYDDAALTQTIESIALKTGFPLNIYTSQPTTDDDFSLRGLFKQNIQVISLAIAMLISFALQPLLPQFSEWSFVAICLLGLVPIGKKAITLARSGTPFSIETLMSVAAIGALYLGETIEAAMVLLLFLLGEKLEAYASSRARSGVKSLMALVPEDAVKIVDGERVHVSVNELIPEDIIEVSPGSRLPADGVIQTSASFDESALTGESLPVEHLVDDQVLAGSVVVDKVVRLRVTSKQGENAIDRILHLIEQAESHKAPLERFLDRFSRWYTPAMMALALLVIITPPLLFEQPWETWVYRGLALLLIACPCALVISTPAAITSGLAVAAKRGALIKGGAALEQLGRIETVAFDKTGTLTKGEPKVTDVVTLGNITRERLLALAASIELGSTHPLAKSLVAYVNSQHIAISEATEKTAIAGIGVSGIISGVNYCISAPSKVDVPISNEIEQHVARLESVGKTTVLVLEASEVIGVLAWQDTLREDAKDAIDKLHKLGISTLMLTGDNARSAKGIADKIGVEYKAGLLPEDKVDFVQQLAKTKQVAMVGDGINDAPAMKAASIGIAMGSGTDVALEAADSALTHNRLTDVAGIITLSKATLANIRQNIALALGLKAIFLVTSLLGITGLWLAVLADSGATLLVTANALRLLRLK